MSWKTTYAAELAAQSRAAALVTADLAAKTAPSKSAPSSGTLTSTDSNGNNVSVTLLQVIDPAQGADQFTTPDPGTRFIGAEFRITDASKASESDDANSDATIVGSDDQNYTVDFDDIAGCTNFNDGDWSLSPGESITGCVTFELPVSVRVSKVQFNAAGGSGGTTVEWTVTG